MEKYYNFTSARIQLVDAVNFRSGSHSISADSLDIFRDNTIIEAHAHCDYYSA